MPLLVQTQSTDYDGTRMAFTEGTVIMLTADKLVMLLLNPHANNNQQAD